MSGNAKNYIGIYGSISILKKSCPDCKRVAFVIDSKMACCGLEVSNSIPQRKKRETLAIKTRGHVSVVMKRQKLAEQNYCCFYCLHPFRGFGRRVKNGKIVSYKIKTQFDHQIPFSYCPSSRASNFVAACHVCNRIKYSHVFKTIEEARKYINEKRQEKGYLSGMWGEIYTEA